MPLLSRRARIDLDLLKVTFLAGTVLLVETVLFHVLNFVFDYYAATLVVGFAVLGIGIGAFAASRTERSERSLFVLCCAGTTICLYLCCLAIIGYPTLWLCEAATGLCFVFPVLYISAVFRRRSARRVYFFDMLGAGLGIATVVLLYGALGSEEILLLVATAVPAAGLVTALRSPGARWTAWPLLALTAAGAVLLGMQLGTDALNLFDLLSKVPAARAGDLDRYKAFRFQADYPRVATYDNLVGRVDVLRYRKHKPGWSYLVAYNGYSNDTIRPYRAWRYEELTRYRWPTRDIRVLYGLVARPRVLIIGSAAEGIVKPLKRITPARNILPVEINPAILEIMQRDFYTESAAAYEGLRPVRGNALSLLHTSGRRFDVITLINAHSTKTVGFLGGPNPLHTLESYRLYLDHLSEDGYLLFEERPMNKRGQLGVFRIIHTMWQALVAAGARDPRDHFVIWDWMAGRALRRPFRELSWDHYLGFIVTKRPLRGRRGARVIRWLRRMVVSKKLSKRIDYLHGYRERQPYRRLMAMLRSGDLSPLERERDFDASVATDNRPFVQSSTRSTPRLDGIVLTVGLTALVFWLALSWIGFRKEPWRPSLGLNLYQVLIGLAYFFIEVVFIQIHQHLFLSPTTSLVLVLGLLLVSSGVGGLLSSRLRPWLATTALLPLLAATLLLPPWLLEAGVPLLLTQAIALGLVAASGLCMGIFFPRGLEQARTRGMEHRIPHLFAINSVAGSFAVILSLYVAMHAGFRETLYLAMGCYALATLLDWLLARAAPVHPPSQVRNDFTL